MLECILVSPHWLRLICLHGARWGCPCVAGTNVFSEVLAGNCCKWHQARQSLGPTLCKDTPPVAASILLLLLLRPGCAGPVLLCGHLTACLLLLLLWCVCMLRVHRCCCA